jgi:hypothetical protein
MHCIVTKIVTDEMRQLPQNAVMTKMVIDENGHDALHRDEIGQ